MLGNWILIIGAITAFGMYLFYRKNRPTGEVPQDHQRTVDDMNAERAAEEVADLWPEADDG